MESSRIMREKMKMSKIKNEINMNYENMMKVYEKVSGFSNRHCLLP